MNANSFNRRRRAFTLVEMIVAVVLIGVIMAGVWGLFHTFGRLFGTGQANAEQAQLVRALFEQITDDLTSAIQDPGPASERADNRREAVRRFCMIGETNRLQFDVLQVTPLEDRPLPGDNPAGDEGEQRSGQVPELRTVQYVFTPHASDGSAAGMNGSAPHGVAAEGVEANAAEAGPSRLGLVRRDLDFETPVDEVGPGYSGGMEAAEENGDPVAVDPLTLIAGTDSYLWVPEVVDARFRYYDGRSWSSRWDSLERESLPVAIEVTVQMAQPSPEGFVPRGAEPRSAAEPRVNAAEPPGDELPLDNEFPLEVEGNGETRLRGGPSYRMVVYLPTARLQAERRPPRQTPAPVTPPAPPPVTPPPVAAPPTPPQPQREADRWLRTTPG